MRLLIVSDMAHYARDGRMFGWGPAVREIDCLARAFSEVRHVATLHAGAPPPTALPYGSPHVTVVALEPSGGRGLAAKLGIARRSPRYLVSCLRELRRADAVHVRCPTAISLEALLLLRFARRPALRWAKYAGNWRPEGPEPFFYGLQRRWLERGVHGGLVTVNGEWPGQPDHVRSMHNPCFSEAGLQSARTVTRHKQIGEPLRLLFAGQLRPSKGADRAVRILAVLRERGWRARLDIAGDGPQLGELRNLRERLDLGDSVSFHGWLSAAELQELYREAHFLLLPSTTEGWPKVISEAMAYRAVPLAGAVSGIPQILRRTQAGVALCADDFEAFAGEIERLARAPGVWRWMAANGQRAAAEFTYEQYLERICGLLELDQPQRVEPCTEAVA